MRTKRLSMVAIVLFLFLVFSMEAKGAMLTYSFDDGHISVYSLAYPILGAYGQVGTANVISNTVRWADSGETSRVNSAQLIEMQQSGWEICSHSKTHPHFSHIPRTYEDELITGWEQISNTSTYMAHYSYGELPFLMEDSHYLRKKLSLDEVYTSPGTFYYDANDHLVYVHATDSVNPSAHAIRSDSVQRELEVSRDELLDRGLNISSFVVPFSDWSYEMEDLAKLNYESAAAGYHNGWFNSIPPNDNYWLARRPVGPGTSVEEVEQWITDAIEDGKWLILMFHRIVNNEDAIELKTDWPAEQLNELVRWVAKQHMPVVTVAEAVKMCEVPLPPSVVALVSGLLFVLVVKRRCS